MLLGPSQFHGGTALNRTGAECTKPTDSLCSTDRGRRPALTTNGQNRAPNSQRKTPERRAALGLKTAPSERGLLKSEPPESTTTLAITTRIDTLENQDSDATSRFRNPDTTNPGRRNDSRLDAWSLGATLLAIAAVSAFVVGCRIDPSTQHLDDGRNQSQSPTLTPETVTTPTVDRKATPSSSTRDRADSPNRQNPAITYYIVKGARFFDSLVARIGTREHVVLGEIDDMCLDLPDQRDFDGDGTQDALVFQSTACSGNGAPGLLFFVSGDPFFRRSNSFKGHQPRIEQWSGHWSVLTASTRHILKDGNAVLVEENASK